MTKFAIAVAAGILCGSSSLCHAEATTIDSGSQKTMMCQSVNGETTCLTGPGALSCVTINGRTACRRESGQGAEPQPALGMDPGVIDPGMVDPGMVVVRKDGSLYIRTGTVDVKIE